jgi:hypothetical protein
MARPEINIGFSANDGNGDPLRTAFSKINSMTTELYLDDAGDVNSIIATAPIARDSATGVVTISLTDGGISTQKIADDAITHAKLGAEFTTTGAVTTALDFGANQVFTKTMSGDTTFTYSNVGIGMVKDFILTGSFVPTFPSGTKTVAGTYDGSVSNLIQIVAIASGDYWMSISKAQ